MRALVRVRDHEQQTRNGKRGNEEGEFSSHLLLRYDPVSLAFLICAMTIALIPQPDCVRTTSVSCFINRTRPACTTAIQIENLGSPSTICVSSLGVSPARQRRARCLLR